MKIICHDIWQCSRKSTKEKVHPTTVMWWTGSNYAHPAAHMVTCLAMVYFSCGTSFYHQYYTWRSKPFSQKLDSDRKNLYKVEK
jgi:hypothetical protein